MSRERGKKREKIWVLQRFVFWFYVLLERLLEYSPIGVHRSWNRYKHFFHTVIGIVVVKRFILMGL
jgi:hypothetical protein